VTRIDYAKVRRPYVEPLPDEVEWAWVNRYSGVVHLTRGCEALVKHQVHDRALRTVRRDEIGKARRCRFCWR
jgi:hypothetical protein